MTLLSRLSVRGTSLALLCLAAVATLAEQPANKSEGAVSATSALHVKIDGGSIRLEGSGGDQISYLVRHSGSSKAHRRDTAPLYKVAAYTRGNTSWLVATHQGNHSNIRPVEFLVRVPREVESVALETSGGDVSVQGVTSRIQVITSGGHLHIDDVRGAVSAETGGENIDVGAIGSDGHFRTGGGRISVDSIKGNLDAFTGGGSISLGTGMRNAVLQSGAGDVSVTFCGGELIVQSGGGNLVLGDVGGPADIRTEGGNLHLHSAKGFVRAHTGAGNIELDEIPAADAWADVGSILAKFTASAGPRRNSSLQTSIGDITVFLPADLPITVHAKVDLGGGQKITSELPGMHISPHQDGQDSPVFAEAKLNGGGPVLEVHAGNGNIFFKKLEH